MHCFYLETFGYGNRAEPEKNFESDKNISGKCLNVTKIRIHFYDIFTVSDAP